jgi:hypothetical protein
MAFPHFGRTRGTVRSRKTSEFSSSLRPEHYSSVDRSQRPVTARQGAARRIRAWRFDGILFLSVLSSSDGRHARLAERPAVVTGKSTHLASIRMVFDRLTPAACRGHRPALLPATRKARFGLNLPVPERGQEGLLSAHRGHSPQPTVSAAQTKPALRSQFPTRERVSPHPCLRGESGRARQTFSRERQKNTWSPSCYPICYRSRPRFRPPNFREASEEPGRGRAPAPLPRGAEGLNL